jgi:predicted Zn-dependent protease
LKQQLTSIDPAKFPRNIIYADAELGRIAAAEAALKVLESQTPETDTIRRDVLLAQPRAATALARRQPQEAIADLEVDRNGDLSGLEAPLMRGRAYLAAQQPQLAEREFRNIVNHDFVSPGRPFVPLAHLGLARALEMGGDHAAARHEYETLFAIWKDADPDLRPLVQARLEYARIR